MELNSFWKGTSVQIAAFRGEVFQGKEAEMADVVFLINVEQDQIRENGHILDLIHHVDL